MAEKFEAWGLVELMGHQRAAGRLSEQTVGGGNLLRVDIPEGDTFRTVFYGASAIYAVHVTDEAAARALAGRNGTRPTYAWELEGAAKRIGVAPERIHNDDTDEPDNNVDDDGECPDCGGVGCPECGGNVGRE